MEPFFSAVRLVRDRVENWEAYPYTVPAVAQIEKLRFDKPVTFLVGENGSGKSTLIEALAVAAGFNPEGGSKNFNFATSDTHSKLYDAIALKRGGKREKDGFFLRAESFYNVSSEVEALEKVQAGLLASYGGKSLHHQSHGESFIALVKSRFGGNGVYFMDEPEAALSPARQLVLLMEIERLARDSQLVIATHSPILMAYPNSRLYWLDESGFVERDWKDTPHYEITRRFLDHPGAYLRHLDPKDL